MATDYLYNLTEVIPNQSATLTFDDYYTAYGCAVIDSVNLYAQSISNDDGSNFQNFAESTTSFDSYVSYNDALLNSYSVYSTVQVTVTNLRRQLAGNWVADSVYYNNNGNSYTTVYNINFGSSVTVSSNGNTCGNQTPSYTLYAQVNFTPAPPAPTPTPTPTATPPPPTPTATPTLPTISIVLPTDGTHLNTGQGFSVTILGQSTPGILTTVSADYQINGTDVWTTFTGFPSNTSPTGYYSATSSPISFSNPTTSSVVIRALATDQLGNISGYVYATITII